MNRLNPQAIIQQAMNNSQMTEERLCEELSKSTYSSMAILFTMENVKKKFSA